MRGNRVVVVLGAAIVMGILATFLVWRLLNRPVDLQASEKASDVVQVVAAKVDLAVGSLVTEEQVKRVALPAGTLPPGTFSDEAQVVNRAVIVPMVANETVLESKLAAQGSGGGLAPVIPEGMRAVSVKVDEVVGVAGFVLPATRVDVLVTVETESERQTRLTKQVLQNVQVLAAGETIQTDAEGKPQSVTVITLLVSPEDAEKLTLAATEGQIQLALRNTLDQDSVSTAGTDIDRLVSLRRPASALAPRPRGIRAVAPPRPKTDVEMYRGVEKDVKSF